MFEKLPVSEISPMALKMDYSSVPMTPFDTPTTANYPPAMTFKKMAQDERHAIRLHDAATFEGQQIGVILQVKRAVKATGLRPPLAKVGDYVEVLAHFNVNQAEVKNIRTGMSGTVDWENLLPVPYDEKCGCLIGGCRCIYETWQAYSARRPLRLMPVSTCPDLNGMYGMVSAFPMMGDWAQVDYVHQYLLINSFDASSDAYVSGSVTSDWWHHAKDTPRSKRPFNDCWADTRCHLSCETSRSLSS